MSGPRFEKKRKALHPDGAWTCPSCHTMHDFPHWKDHHQIEKIEKTNACEDYCKESDPEHEFEKDGVTPKPLYCPRCGFEEDRYVFAKIKKGEVLQLA